MSKIFITGGTGYVGTALVQEIIDTKLQAVVLTRSSQKADALRARGLEAVVGDLMEDGPWQQKLAECEYVIHLASPPTWGKKVTTKIAEQFAKGHYDMTLRLLDHIDVHTIKNIVYIAGTSYYGDTGAERPRDADFTSEPKGWGPYIANSVNVLDRYIQKGMPITTAFPAQIYGPDSWMPQLFIEPIYNKKPVYSLKGYEPYFSPIHVEDTARACLFLCEHGKIGDRYILCDNEPLTSNAFMKLIEKELQLSGKVRSIPRWLCKLILGPVLTEYATAHTYFTNRKLKELGFTYRYPTALDGVPNVVQSWVSKQG
ncbi:NAD-dependent epimerase/dehydratase family protein [Paenibacillus sp. 2TAB19]|uniref:NAD-dependent epimerase/dehydratase family protein n=1 Tax=Paenibacillus sp. 2TAB19 TaxID=3233003 RepID=UPI003F99F80A